MVVHGLKTPANRCNTHDASQSYWRTEGQSDSRNVQNWADSIANAADQSGSRKRNYWTYSTADVRQTSLSFSKEPVQEIPHQIFQERTGYLEDSISVRGSSSTPPQEISSQTAQNNPLGTQGRWYQEESSGTLWDVVLSSQHQREKTGTGSGDFSSLSDRDQDHNQTSEQRSITHRPELQRSGQAGSNRQAERTRSRAIQLVEKLIDDYGSNIKPQIVLSSDIRSQIYWNKLNDVERDEASEYAKKCLSEKYKKYPYKRNLMVTSIIWCINNTYSERRSKSSEVRTNQLGLRE
jgi:hypothetical protein